MGTLEKFRTLSPYAMGAFAVIFVGFMVIQDAGFDALHRGGQDRKTANIGEVNGESFKFAEFDEKVTATAEQQRKQSQSQGSEEGADIDYSQIKSQVWQEMVETALINQIAKQTGVLVTKEVVADMLLTNPPSFVKQWFTDSTGNFQRQPYLEMITNPENYVNKSQANAEQKAKMLGEIRTQLNQVAEYMQKTETQTNLTQVINYAASVISPAYAKQKYIDDNTSTDVAYISIDSRSQNPDDYKVSDKEIEDYYNAHKLNYKIKDLRKAKFINFPIQPSSQDTLQANKKLQKMIGMLREAKNQEDSVKVFERYQNEFNGETVDFTLINKIDESKAPYLIDLPIGQIAGPLRLNDGTYFFRVEERRNNPDNESRKTSHILISFDNNKDSAKAVAEAIYKKAKAGEDFAKLAEENSKDPGSARQGGDLGYNAKGVMVKEFDDAAFAANVGDIVGPIETKFGYHIIKVVDKKSEELKYSEIKISPKVTNNTRKAIMKSALDLVDKIKQGNNFDTLAIQLNKRVNETGFIEKTKPILGNYYLTAEAFKSPKGTILEPIELKNYGVVVVQVSEDRKAGIAPLEDKKVEIEGIVKNAKILDAIKAKADAAYDKVKSLTDLTQASTISPELNVQIGTAVKNNGAVPNSGGRDFVFTSKLQTLPMNTVNAPIRGEIAYYITQVTNRVNVTAEQIKAALPEYTKTLFANAKSSAYYQWFQQTKNDAQIIDKRTSKEDY